MPGRHQIPTHVPPGADETAGGFLLQAGDRNRDDLVQVQQPGQLPRIARISLDVDRMSWSTLVAAKWTNPVVPWLVHWADAAATSFELRAYHAVSAASSLHSCIDRSNDRDRGTPAGGPRHATSPSRWTDLWVHA